MTSSGRTNIHYDVFVDCPSLETIYYEGSEADRAKIIISDDNATLNQVQIVYNYKG